MGKLLIAIVVLGAALPMEAQPAPSKYQSGSIMAVKAHNPGASEKPSNRLFDVTVRVGSTLYVVLYTQPPGTVSPEYRVGLTLPVLVGSKTLKLNDMLGRPRELPILSRKTVSKDAGSGNLGVVYKLPHEIASIVRSSRTDPLSCPRPTAFASREAVAPPRSKILPSADNS